MSIEEQFIKAASKFGVSTQEMINAIMRMNEALSRLEYHANEITAIKDDLYDLRYETENIQSGLDCRTALLEMELNDLRSAMDAKTENPNQKRDLEIFDRIIPSEGFLKLEGNMFLN